MDLEAAQPKAVVCVTVGDICRCSEGVQGRLSVEHDLAGAVGFYICKLEEGDSRIRNARYGPDSLIYGWANWASSGTVEYSYQHRLQRRMNKATSSQVLGADLGIMDNYYIGTNFIGNVSCGADVSHQDQYYNVSYFDMSVRSFIDKNEQLENSTLYNRPGLVLNKIEQLD